MYSLSNIQMLLDEYSRVNGQYQELLLSYGQFPFGNADAREYVYHGFLRRIKTLKRCIQNVYTICPPDRSERPSPDELTDLAINMQSFVFNTFGCIEDLAWIWVKENEFSYSRNTDVSLFKTNISSQLSLCFRQYLNSVEYKKWFEYLKDFRDALAHRIPLYVPPSVSLNLREKKCYQDLQNEKEELDREICSLKAKLKAKWNRDGSEFPITKLNALNDSLNKAFQKKAQLTDEQNNLGEFIPIMTHSLTEPHDPIQFHSQLLEDWKMILETAKMFLEELNYQSSGPVVDGNNGNRE